MPSPRLLCSAVLAASSLLGASRAQADLTTNAEVTGNIIFGSGNADGGFVVFQDPMTGLELGLRAKVRYPAPLNVFNNSGNVYTHAAGLAGPGLSRAFWSFDYSVNTNYNGAGNSFDLAGLTFELEIDADPAVGAITPGTFDPLAWGDTAFGDNTTAFGGGTIASAPIAGTNLGQNSLNYGFFPGLQAATNNFAAGEYTLTLRALSGSTVVGATQILVSAVPEPSAFLFGGLMSGVAGWSIRRSRDEA